MSRVLGGCGWFPGLQIKRGCDDVSEMFHPMGSPEKLAPVEP